MIIKEEVINKINTTGYIIIKNVISITENDIKIIEKQIDTNKVYIFNQDWDDNDKKRMQTDLNEENLSFISILNDTINSINPLLKKSNWVIIKSEPDCHKQLAHLDYIPTKNFNEIINGQDKYIIPLLVLSSLMNNTYIHIWDKSIEIMNGSYNGEPIKSNKILLDKGDILIFRSDIIHAGSEYEIENIRLHCYLDSPFIDREIDTTFIVSLDSPELTKIIIE